MRRCTTALAALIFVLLAVPSALLASQEKASGAAPATPSATPAETKAAPSRLRFAVIGDTGTGKEPQFQVARRMDAVYAQEPYEFVLMLGDNTYSGTLAKKADDVFNIPYKNLLDKGVRFYVTLGNHDQDDASAQVNFPKFNMGGKPNYSFTPAGSLVEFFTFNSTPLAEKGQVNGEIAWLEAALKTSRAQWKIVFMHHPPYSAGRRHGDNQYLIDTLLPILKRNGVRIVMTGHEHFFARMRDRDGISYIISGSGGKIHKGGLQPDHPNLIAGNDQIFQFLTVDLTADTFSYVVHGSNGQDLYRESIPFRAGTKQ